MSLEQFKNQYVDGKEVADSPDGEFVTYGNIAGYTQVHTYNFYVRDATTIPSDGKAKPEFSDLFNSGGARVHYYDRKVSEEALLELAPDMYVNRSYVLSTSVDGILNMTDEVRQKFDNPNLTANVTVAGWRSKNFAAWNLITLPSIVVAVAGYCGVNVPQMDLSDLYTFDENKWTDSFQETMVGHLDNESYKQSRLFLQRARIWDALGEGDPLVSSPGKTKSETLSVALNFALTRKNQFMGKVGNVFDPQIRGQVTKVRVPVVYDIYATKEEMEKAAAADLASRGSVISGVSVGADNIPASYADSKSDFEEAVKELRGSGATLHEAAEEMALSDAELGPYWESLEG